MTTESSAGFAQPLFIGGLHRSGTSLLARMMSEHPLFGGLRETGAPEDEGQHVQNVMLPASAFGGPGHFAFDPRSHLTEADVDAVHAGSNAAQALRMQLVDSWAKFRADDKPFFVEKSPPNLLRFRFLQSLFPDAQCVLVVRHPIAVSHATEFWAKSSIASLLTHWCHAHELVHADIPCINRLLVVRYEDLVADPNATLARVTAACGVEPHTTTEVVRTDTNDRYFARFRHHKLLPASLKILPHRLRFEARLQRLGYGYSLADHGGH